MYIFTLIPAYNEKGNLELLTKKLGFVYKKIKAKYELFYVLQGKDGSLEEIKKIQKKYKHVSYVYYPNPLGIGRAYREGFHKINTACTHVMTLDADLNHDPNQIPIFIKSLKKSGKDIIIGSRFMSGGEFKDKRIWKRIISLIVNTVITKLFQLPVHDVTSGFRLMKKNVVIKVRSQLIQRGYPSYMEFILYAVGYGYKLGEISITYTPRVWGKSKMNKMRTLLDYLFFMPKIAYSLLLKNPD